MVRSTLSRRPFPFRPAALPRLPALLTALGLGIAAVMAAPAAMAEQYTILIYETPADLAARTDPARAPGYWGAFGSYAQSLQQAGVLRGGMALHGDDQARVVTRRDGVVAEAAGPRAAGPDQLGGFFMIEVATREEAMAWAAKAPSAASGAVEVRPDVPPPAPP